MKKGKNFSHNHKSERFLILRTNNKKLQSLTKEEQNHDPVPQEKCGTCTLETATNLI